MPWDVWGAELRARIAWALLGSAMVAFSVLLLWEGRGLTLLVDEWRFGYFARTDFGVAELLEPENGHLAVIPILLTRASHELFGADTTLPLRIVAIGAHLAVVAMFYSFLRRDLGPIGALIPALLILFLGSASDIFVGSHAIPIEIAVATGLGAWLALRSDRLGHDVLAASLLLVGVLSNGFALVFMAGAAAIVVLDSRSWRSRIWVVAAPLAVYATWWLGYGHDADSGFAIGNVGGLPAYAFDSLAAALAALTGVFTDPGATQQGFEIGPGQALAGATLVALLVLAVRRAYRPPRASVPALIALLALWIATGLVGGPERPPASPRYVYSGALLVLLALAPTIAELPQRRRAAIALAAVSAVALLPNVREIHYSGTFFRAQSNIDRAVLGAVDLAGPQAPGSLPIETEESAAPGSVVDMRAPVATYREARSRFGTPAFSLDQLQAADPGAREAGDRLLARALGLRLAPARGRPSALPTGLAVSTAGGSLRRRRGCIEFVPLVAGATLTMPLPSGGIWVEPAVGPLVPVALRRFGDAFAIDAGGALGGRAASLRLPPGPGGRDWQAQLTPQQRTVLCGL